MSNANIIARVIVVLGCLLACAAAKADAPRPTSPHPELICQVVTKTLTVCSRK